MISKKDIDKLTKLTNGLVTLRQQIDSVDDINHPSSDWDVSWHVAGNKSKFVLSPQQKSVLKTKMLVDLKNEFSEKEAEILIILRAYKNK